MSDMRLRRFFYVLLKHHLPYDALQKAVDKAAAYEKPNGMESPDDHPLMAAARTLSRRVQDPPESR